MTYVNIRILTPHLLLQPFIYKLFILEGNYGDFPIHEITTCFYRGDEIFGAWGSMLQDRIAELPTVKEKITLLQQLLLDKLYKSNRGDERMDYVIGQIVSRNGLVRIEELSNDLVIRNAISTAKVARFIYESCLKMELPRRLLIY